jgi:hypothetical protein
VYFSSGKGSKKKPRLKNAVIITGAAHFFWWAARLIILQTGPVVSTALKSLLFGVKKSIISAQD